MQAVAQQAPAKQNQPLTADQFLSITTPQIVPVTSNLPYIDGGTATINLPQTGMAHRMFLTVQAKIVVAGTITGGTFQGWPNPGPFSIVKRIRFGSNAAVSIRNLSGLSAYLWSRYRYGLDSQSFGNNVLYSANNMQSLGMQNSARIVPGANVSAQTYFFNFCIPIDISYNEAAERCLLNLQSNSVIWQLGLDWGAVSGAIGATGGTNDLFNGLTGSGISITPTITATLNYEFFETVSADVSDLTSQFMSVQDQVPVQALTAGQNIVRPPVTELYTMVLMQLYNNALPLDIPTNATNIAWQFAGNVYQYQTDPLSQLAHDAYQHRIPPPDGVIAFDLGTRRGFLTRRDTIDAFNNANIVDLQLRWSLPGNINLTGNQGVNAIYESLLSASN